MAWASRRELRGADPHLVDDQALLEDIHRGCRLSQGIAQEVLTEALGHIGLPGQHFGVDMPGLHAEGALKSHLLERCAHWLALGGQIDHGLLHREVLDNDIPRRGLVWMVFDKPKVLFEVHPILAIDLQPHLDPGDDGLIDDNTSLDERPQPNFGDDLGDVDGSFERGLAALHNADPARRSREGQEIKCDILHGQPGIYARVVCSEAHTSAQHHKPVLARRQDSDRGTG